MSSKLYKEIQAEFYSILENKLEEIFKDSNKHKTINVRKYDSYLNGIEEDIKNKLTKKANMIANDIISEFEDIEIKIRINKALKELFIKIYYEIQINEVSYKEFKILMELLEVSKHILDSDNTIMLNNINSIIINKIERN